MALASTQLDTYAKHIQITKYIREKGRAENTFDDVED